MPWSITEYVNADFFKWNLRKCNKSSLNQIINIYMIHNLCINKFYAVIVPI